MTLSVLTLLTGLVVVYGVVNRGGYGKALALSGATPAGAAVVASGVGVPTFYAAAIGVAIALVVAVLVRRRGAEAVTLPPGGSLLVAFLVWSTGVTLLAPLVFDGLQTVTPFNQVLRAGTITTSNIAQCVYLALGVAVVVFLGRSPRSDPHLLGLAAGLCTILSAWRYGYVTFGLPFPEGVFDNSPTFAFIETAIGGAERFRGVLSEPAGLASSSLVTIGYMLSRAAQTRGLRRIGCLVLAGAALYLGIISTSATFVVAGIALLVVVGMSGILGFLSRRTALSRLLTVVGCGVVVAALWVLPLIVGFVESTINEKLTSSSYSNRSSANGDSIDIFLDTYGLGVGLGSARASSFMPTLLSATGLVGTVLFGAAVATLIYRGSFSRPYRPVIWALVALLVVKLAAGPDISDSSGVLWMALGLLSQAIAHRTPDQEHPPGSRTPVASMSGAT